MNNASDEIINELESVSSELLNAISLFEQDEINTKVHGNGWTAGQVAEHLLKSGVAGLLYGKVEKTQRDPGEKIEELKSIFLDFNTKFKSPDFNTPTGTKHDRDELLKSLGKAYNDARNAAGSLDLSETCTVFELPGLGKMTHLEWLYFMVFHTRRHTRQIKNIFQELNSKKNEIKQF